MALVCNSWTFQCVRTLCGLTNAPACSQRDLILTYYTSINCLVNLHDVIIFSTNINDHLKRVEDMLTKLADDGVKLKINNCNVSSKNQNILNKYSNTKTCKSTKVMSHPYVTWNRRRTKNTAKIAPRIVKCLSTVFWRLHRNRSPTKQAHRTRTNWYIRTLQREISSFRQPHR